MCSRRRSRVGQSNRLDGSLNFGPVEVCDPGLGDPLSSERCVQRCYADEARHAELAWRSLAWLVAEHGSVASDAATRAFEQAAREVRRDLPPTRDASPRHGLLSAEDIRAVRLAALREVVEPLARAALSSASSSPS